MPQYLQGPQVCEILQNLWNSSIEIIVMEGPATE
jgi:hypothetical protein